MTGKINKHNGIISFWKFMFSIMIFMHHYGLYYSSIPVKYKFIAGSIGVEFFFIVSGYLFCNSILNKFNSYDVRNHIIYFKNKFLYFLKFIVLLWLISLVFMIFVDKASIQVIFKCFFDTFYFYRSGDGGYGFGTTWYIIAMLLVEFIIYPFLIKYKEKYIYAISPILIFFSGNYFFINFKDLSNPWLLSIFSYDGIYRALFSINIGIFLYGLNQKFSNINFTNFSRFILTIIEVVGYSIVFYLVNKVDAHYKYDATIVLILSICILISFSKQSLLYDFCCNNLFYKLEKISLPLYINQYILIFTISYLLNKFSIPLKYYKLVMLEIIILIILGILEYRMFDYMNLKQKDIKKLFINKNIIKNEKNI